MTTFVDIQKALDSALMGTDFGIPVTLENIDDTSDINTPFINAYLLPAQPEQSGLGDNGTDFHEGVYQIDINYPLKSGTVNHHTVADALNAVFRSGADLTFNGVCVRVQSTGITPKRNASGWSIMSVNVNYFVTTQRI